LIASSFVAASGAGAATKAPAKAPAKATVRPAAGMKVVDRDDWLLQVPETWTERPDVAEKSRSATAGDGSKFEATAAAWGDGDRVVPFVVLIRERAKDSDPTAGPRTADFHEQLKASLQGGGWSVVDWKMAPATGRTSSRFELSNGALQSDGVAISTVDPAGHLHGWTVVCASDPAGAADVAACARILDSFSATLPASR
jgi:hypothetical protein